jgi:hypothetical protein
LLKVNIFRTFALEVTTEHNADMETKKPIRVIVSGGGTG